jgi:hypothetical protein
MAKPICIQRMSDNSQLMFGNWARVRLQALACRRLADLAGDAERETLWRQRASDLEQFVTRAEKKLRPKGRSKL